MHFPKIKISIGYRISCKDKTHGNVVFTVFNKHQSKPDAIQVGVNHMSLCGVKVGDNKISVKRQINIELTF